MNTRIARVAKALAGIVVLVILFTVVSRWYGEYRQQLRSGASETTSTAPPQGEGSTKEATSTSRDARRVIVLTSGLNFRDQPSRDGNKIRGLKKGERLTLLKSEGEWYYVEDRTGARGWISSNKSYVKIAD